MEQCSNNTSEMDDATLLANLIEQLEQKRIFYWILTNKSLMASVMMIWKLKYLNQGKKSEVSSTMTRVKCLIQQFQALPTLLNHYHLHELHKSLDCPPQYLQELTLCRHLLSHHQFIRKTLNMTQQNKTHYRD